MIVPNIKLTLKIYLLDIMSLSISTKFSVDYKYRSENVFNRA